MYGKLIALRDFTNDALAEANNRASYYELTKTLPKENPVVADAFCKLVNSILCADYLDCQASGGNVGADGQETERLEELINLADEYDVESVTTTIEIAIYRQMAIKAYNVSNWRVAVLLLNKIVARCCTPADLNQKSASTVLPTFSPCLGDALMMLSEAYAHMNKPEDAMKSARCAVDIVQSGIERGRSSASPPEGGAGAGMELPPSSLEDSWDIGPGLQPPFSLVCCYFNLGSLLDKMGLLKFGIGWYRRALTVANNNRLDRRLVSQLKEAYSMADSFLKLDSRSDVLVINSHRSRSNSPPPVEPEEDEAPSRQTHGNSNSNVNANANANAPRSSYSGRGSGSGGGASGGSIGGGSGKGVSVDDFASPHSRGPSLKATGKSKSALPRLHSTDEGDAGANERIIPNPFPVSSSGPRMPNIPTRSPTKPGAGSGKAASGKTPAIQAYPSNYSNTNGVPISALTSVKGTPKREDSSSLEGFEDDMDGILDGSEDELQGDELLFGDDIKVSNVSIPIPVPVLREVVLEERERVLRAEREGLEDHRRELELEQGQGQGQVEERKVYISSGTRASSEFQSVKKGKNARLSSQDSGRESLATATTGRSEDSGVRRERDRKRKCKSTAEYKAAYKIMHYAATVINSLGRGYVTRKYIKAVNKHRAFMNKLRRQRRAAVTIQACIRSFLARRKVHSILLLRSSLISITLGNSMKSSLNMNVNVDVDVNRAETAGAFCAASTSNDHAVVPFSPGKESSLLDMQATRTGLMSHRSMSSNTFGNKKGVQLPVITNGDMGAMIEYLQEERRGIEAKKAELMRLTELEKKKLTAMLDELQKRDEELGRDVALAASRGTLLRSPSSRRGFDSRYSSPQSSPKRAQSPNTEFKSRQFSRDEPREAGTRAKAKTGKKSTEEAVAAPHTAKYHKGQKVEAKYLGSVIKTHNVTWHGGRILHVHDRRSQARAGEKVKFFYDVIFSNGEIELKVADEFIRLPLTSFSVVQNAKAAAAVTGGAAGKESEKTIPGAAAPTTSRMVAARRNMLETAMHKFSMHAQFQSIGRREKRSQERFACRNHNIVLFQKVFRGFVVRKYFYRYKKYIMKERLVAAVDAKTQQGRGQSTGRIRLKGAASALMLMSFANFREKYFHRMKRDAQEATTPVKAGLTVAHTSMDERLHAENKLLNSEIQSYYEMLISCQCDLQKLRNDIYALSRSTTNKISRLHSATQESVRKQQEKAQQPPRQPSPVFARLALSPSRFDEMELSADVGETAMVAEEPKAEAEANAEAEAEANAEADANDEPDADAEDEADASINFLDMRVVHSIVQEYVQSAINSALTPKKNA